MPVKTNFDVTCRYGTTYNVELHGSKGAKFRTLDMLGKCCCFVCHNHECKTPIEKRIPCNFECKIYGAKTLWCETK